LRSKSGEGFRSIEGPYPLTPALSPWERERTSVAIADQSNLKASISNLMLQFDLAATFGGSQNGEANLRRRETPFSGVKRRPPQYGGVV
jgi:hypothetical protein